MEMNIIFHAWGVFFQNLQCFLRLNISWLTRENSIYIGTTVNILYILYALISFQGIPLLNIVFISNKLINGVHMIRNFMKVLVNLSETYRKILKLGMHVRFTFQFIVFSVLLMMAKSGILYYCFFIRNMLLRFNSKWTWNWFGVKTIFLESNNFLG